MGRTDNIIQAGIDYTLSTNPMCIGGDAFSDVMRELNRNKSFEEGAKWADQTILDKACEWLIDNAAKYITQSTTTVWYDTVALKHQFRKAMEE